MEHVDGLCPECVTCGEDFPQARADLGYTECLKCGEKSANEITQARKKCMAPAYSKGAYQYVSSKEQVRGIHAKHWVK